MSKVKDRAERIVGHIERERIIAEDKLEAAKPALQEAEDALCTIKPANIATVRKLGRPPHLIMRVMDCVIILFRKKVRHDPFWSEKSLIGLSSQLAIMAPDPTVPSPKPSWGEALKIMAGTSFLSQLLNFPKDTINDEMVELLEPYLTMEVHIHLTKKVKCCKAASFTRITT